MHASPQVLPTRLLRRGLHRRRAKELGDHVGALVRVDLVTLHATNADRKNGWADDYRSVTYAFQNDRGKFVMPRAMIGQKCENHGRWGQRRYPRQSSNAPDTYRAIASWPVGERPAWLRRFSGLATA